MNTTLRRSLFWLDTGIQFSLLLTCLLMTFAQQGFVALIALFFLGAWQLGSAGITGLVLGDKVRLTYFGCASAFLVMFIVLFSKMNLVSFPDEELLFALFMVFSYLAGGFYLGLHCMRSYLPD